MALTLRQARERARHEVDKQDTQGGSLLRQVVLGGQDGLVNVLGIILGVAIATGDSRLVIIAGLAATFAESLSMAAVAYTSVRAVRDYYDGQRERELREIREVPQVEREEIRLIYRRKGFSGKALDLAVKAITSDKERWLRVMMEEELGLYESGRQSPLSEAAVVGGSAFVGSLVPLVPFLLVPASAAVWLSLGASFVVLLVGGAVKGWLTTGDWARSAVEMVVIGGLAAIAGYAVGALLGAASA